LALGAVPFSTALGSWALDTVGLPTDTEYKLQQSLSPWTFETIYGQTTIWVPTPEVARQALVKFLDIWVENATITSGIFLVPRIMQKDWGHISRHIEEIAIVYPADLPEVCTYPSLIPFALLYVPRYSRCLTAPRMDKPAAGGQYPAWHAEQAEYLRGL
jgi:hypothetical protein